MHRLQGFLRRLTLAPIAVAVFALASATHGFAQDSKPKQPPSRQLKTPAPAAKPGPGAVALTEEALKVDSAGLTFFAPEKATVKSTSAGGEPSYQILAEDSTWWIDVRTPATSNSGISVTDAGEAALEQLLARHGEQNDTTNVIKTVAKVLDKTAGLVTDPNRPDVRAFRFYVLLPQVGKSVNVVRGYTLFKVSSNRFVAFELTTPESEFERSRGIYETVVAAARFEDTSAAMSQRAVAVKAGLSLLERIGSKEMQAAIATRNDRWERLYIPPTGGADMDATEVAYRRIRCHEGQRGELDPTRAKSRWSAADKEPGYILQVDARYLDGAKRVVDMQSMFFMTADRSEETWSIRQAVREGDKVATTTETGSRNGKNLTVKTEVSGQPNPQVFSPKFESDGYVSQIESYLLPQLLISAKLPAQYGFYVFQSRDGKVKLRNDTLEQPPDRPNLWKLVTTFADDPQKTRQVSLYNDAGELIRTELPDGKVWEPTDFDRLVKLWRAKDLPMK